MIPGWSSLLVIQSIMLSPRSRQVEVQLWDMDVVPLACPWKAGSSRLVEHKGVFWGNGLFESFRVSFPGLRGEDAAGGTRCLQWCSQLPVSERLAIGGKFCRAWKSVLVEIRNWVASRQKLNPWCWEILDLFSSHDQHGYKTTCKVSKCSRVFFRPTFCTWQCFSVSDSLSASAASCVF